MAVELKVHVKEKLSLGGTRYDYIGTLNFGEYKGSGGNTITSVDGAVSALPAQFDHVTVGSAGGYTAEYVPGAEPKFKAYSTAATEVADKVDLKAIPFTFRAVGS